MDTKFEVHFAGIPRRCQVNSHYERIGNSVALAVVDRQIDPTAGNSGGTLARSRATTAWAGLSWTSAWNRSRRRRTVRLQLGNGAVLYTDGITEAKNLAREQYGLARRCTVVSQHWTAPAEMIKERVGRMCTGIWEHRRCMTILLWW
jgi:hypothetical protein